MLNDDLKFGFSVLIGLTLAVTSEFITLLVVIIFHREFFLKGITFLNPRRPI